VPNDEILGLIGRLEPQILLVYGMTPQGVPQTRQLIDLIREVGVCPTMNIMITGGVFNRAEDLWKEINADLYAPQVRDALDVAGQALPRVPDVRIPGAPKKRRRRRPPLLSQAGSRAACS
jgi:methanogenic corrinoid protein MtbC1